MATTNFDVVCESDKNNVSEIIYFSTLITITKRT